MSPVRAFATVITHLQDENQSLKKEVAKLKKKLGFRHTTINDLRYSKKQLTEALLRHTEIKEL